MLDVGSVFADRYTLVKLLGRGGFSAVWLAEDNKTGVNVAVKIYAPGMGLDDVGISLFTKEFALVFDMNHTNLLHPSYFDCWERMPYLILPYCKNGSAFKYVTAPEHIPAAEAWRMLFDVADGLAYLHAKQPPIIHQDIKPDNILISDEGEYMVTDFGISARVRSTIRKAPGAKNDEVSGTLAYMGPERFSASPAPIIASDVWSLGATMYEVMTGNPPFGEHGGVLQKNGADIPLIEDPQYPEELKQVVYQCLATNPWDRPTAREIADATMPFARHEDPNHTNPLSSSLSRSLGSSLDHSLGSGIHDSQGNPISTTQGEAPNAPKPSPIVTWIATHKPIAIGAAAAVVLLGIIIGVISGRDKSEVMITPEPLVHYPTTGHLDTLCRNRIELGMEDFTTGEQYYRDEKYDTTETGSVIEDYYIDAYAAFVEAKDSANYTTADTTILASAVVLNEIQQHVDTTRARLMHIHDGLKHRAEIMAKYDQKEFQETFEVRMHKVAVATGIDPN